MKGEFMEWADKNFDNNVDKYFEDNPKIEEDFIQFVWSQYQKSLEGE